MPIGFVVSHEAPGAIANALVDRTYATLSGELGTQLGLAQINPPSFASASQSISMQAREEVICATLSNIVEIFRKDLAVVRERGQTAVDRILSWPANKPLEGTEEVQEALSGVISALRGLSDFSTELLIKEPSPFGTPSLLPPKPQPFPGTPLESLSTPASTSHEFLERMPKPPEGPSIPHLYEASRALVRDLGWQASQLCTNVGCFSVDLITALPPKLELAKMPLVNFHQGALRLRHDIDSAYRAVLVLDGPPGYRELAERHRNAQQNDGRADYAI